jgi:pSer/pThr/pTyr-binding forkhead associated (FHA) protein
MSTLEDMEARIKSLIEDRLMNFILIGKPEDQISQKLAIAMYAQSITQEDKGNLAPNIYVVVAHPSNLSRWRQDPIFLDELANSLEFAGHEAGFSFPSKPKLSTSADSSMTENDVRVYASFSLEDISETHGMQMNPGHKNLDESNPNKSFLILHGSEIITIDQSVINIGRRLDNHVVIDDPRISRNHAQIREIKGRFVIFDLNSTGGTFVNGDRINQSVLYPGDVISLAGVTLIFGQDMPPTQQKEEPTRPNSPVSSDRPTVVLPIEKTSEK